MRKCDGMCAFQHSQRDSIKIKTSLVGVFTKRCSSLKKIIKNLDIDLAWRIMEPVKETKGKDKTSKKPNEHRYRHASRNIGSSYSECFNQCFNQMCGSAGEEINVSASTPIFCIEHLHERSFTAMPSSNWSF